MASSIIPALVGLIILGGCMLYTKRQRSADGAPFRGRSIVAALSTIAVLLLLYSLVILVTENR